MLNRVQDRVLHRGLHRGSRISLLALPSWHVGKGVEKASHGARRAQVGASVPARPRPTEDGQPYLEAAITPGPPIN